MNFPITFFKEVEDKYKLKTVLTPKNLGSGEIENAVLSDLRNALNNCIINLDSIILKEHLLDYLEDYIVELAAVTVPSQKEKVKRIKRKIASLENKHPNLNIEKEEDEGIIEEINECQWLLSQESYILAYRKEQKHFLRNWAMKQRRILEKEFTSSSVSEKRKIVVPRDYPFYCEIGVLFAQNKIVKKSSDDKRKHLFYFEGKQFVSINQLSIHIQENILSTNKSVRQYINDTLMGSDTSHNFYKSDKKIGNIISYCEANNVEITNQNFIQGKPV